MVDFENLPKWVECHGGVDFEYLPKEVYAPGGADFAYLPKEVEGHGGDDFQSLPKGIECHGWVDVELTVLAIILNLQLVYIHCVAGLRRKKSNLGQCFLQQSCEKMAYKVQHATQIKAF